jgi:mannose-1-phosphate guanylyltransferase / mannose-6-phosphate isomerase
MVVYSFSFRVGGMTDQLVVPVILCGGAGTRLWPVSREKMPKQFVPLIGTSSTFQQVLDRVTREGLFAPPMIVTNSEFRFVVAEQARSRGVKATIILEPQRRDSAAAIAAAAELAMKMDPGAILLVVAADHLIPDTDAFAAAVRAALPAAAAGAIVTFGVKPTYPAVGADRGAGRQLSRRGRHPAARGRLPPSRRSVTCGAPAGWFKAAGWRG